MKLRNLKEIPFQIASELAKNAKILSLIYNDSSAVLNEDAPSIDVNTLIEKKYIGFYPATESGIKDVDKNTFIIINLEDFNLQNTDYNVSTSGAIYITTDKAHCLLDGGKLRLLELVDEIESTLEGFKFLAAGKVSLTSANYVVFSDFRCGYRINFRISDQTARKAEL
jgi:hypothetical protein